MPFHTALEPESLVDHFLAHPPPGFEPERLDCGAPSFIAPFDLLTTVDEELRARIRKVPLQGTWARLLRWRTRFVGCTVTEYAPLPANVEPHQLADELLDRYGRECALLIVKDLPKDSPLLDAEANQFADALAAALASRGFVLLDGMPLAWVPIDFESVDDYVARLPAGRRKDIRRKLRVRDRVQVQTLPTGSPIFAEAGVIEAFYALYLNVYAQSQIQFDRLAPGFFRSALQDERSGGVVMTYTDESGALIGWNLCYEYAGKLVDKYVGFAYPRAREYNLYTLSWMRNLEYARDRGLSHYVAGWTDAGIKAYLGATFSATRHAVYLRNPWLRSLLRHTAHRFESDAVASR